MVDAERDTPTSSRPPRSGTARRCAVVADRELPLNRRPAVSAAALERTARQAFGWHQLRPGQLEAMQAVVSGRDTVVTAWPAPGTQRSCRSRSLEVDSGGRLALAGDAPGPREAAQAAVDVAEQHRRVEQSRVEMVRGFAETSGCRRQFVLGYFGETLEHPCGNCDTCAAGTAAEQAAVEDSPYDLQTRVRHRTWGEGVVMRYEGDRIVVLFEEVGYKTLLLRAVAERGLLEAAT